MPTKEHFKKETVILQCTWNTCHEVVNSIENLYSHFTKHVIDVSNQALATGDAHFKCGLCVTNLTTDNLLHAIRHVHFHVWLSNLRAIGFSYQNANRWPSCNLSQTDNSIPDFSTPFYCSWQSCMYNTNSIHEFFLHVSNHPQFDQSESVDLRNQSFQCRWETCAHSCNSLAHLVSHLRTHTQEKVIGCPNCGALFTCIVKFRNHLMRQLPSKMSESCMESGAIEIKNQCPHCLRIMGNKSLLRTHINRHINKLNCPFCNLTLKDKYSVKRHILFRHTTERNFPCSHCPKMFKNQHGLNSHIAWCHKELNSEFPDQAMLPNSGGILGPLAAAGAPGILNNSNSISNASIITTPFPSTQPNGPLTKPSCQYCGFKAKTLPGLQVHLKRKHSNEKEQQTAFATNLSNSLYACHLCSTRVVSGFLLSKHLIRFHNFKRPPGHVRFTYASCSDGLIRLQLTRIDSVDVAKTLLGPQTVEQLIENAAGQNMHTVLT